VLGVWSDVAKNLSEQRKELSTASTARVGRKWHTVFMCQ